MTTPVAQAVDSRRSSLRSNGFRFLWAGESVSVLGTTTSSLLLPLLAVTTLDASAWWVGLLTAAAWLPWVVIGLPAGAWVDRSDPLPVMVTANVVAGLAVASVPAAWWLGGLSLAQLGLVALCTGTCSVFFRAAYQRLLPQLVPPEDLVGANSRLQGSESVAQIGGFGIAGLLAQWVGTATGLLLDALSFVASVVSLLLAANSTERTPLAVPPRRRLRTEIGEGVTFVARDPLLRWFTWAGGLSNFASPATARYWCSSSSATSG